MARVSMAAADREIDVETKASVVAAVDSVRLDGNSKSPFGGVRGVVECGLYFRMPLSRI